jgi:peptidoglycan/LPS O-acetylase OafA/YrhL
MVFVALSLLLAVVGSLTLHIAGKFEFGLVALVCAIFVLIASYDGGYFCPNGPIKRVLLWIGSRSYTFYLVHIPAYFLTREIWFHLQPPHTVFTDRFALRFAYTAAILLLVLVELNYRFVEAPLRRRGKRISREIAERNLPQRFAKEE